MVTQGRRPGGLQWIHSVKGDPRRRKLGGKATEKEKDNWETPYVKKSKKEGQLYQEISQFERKEMTEHTLSSQQNWLLVVLVTTANLANNTILQEDLGK